MTRTSFGEAIYELSKPTNLVDLLEGTLQKHPDRPVFGVKNASGDFEWMFYREFGKRVDHLRGALAHMGIQKGDAVGIIANNCPEWAIGAYATYGLEARWVPMYEKELLKTWQYIISDADIKLLFVATQQIYDEIQQHRSEFPMLKEIILLDGEGEKTLHGLENLGEKFPIQAIHPDSSAIACLIYTSGTTGNPKGVLLSHGNLTFCSQSGWHIFPSLNENSVTLNHLPFAHSYALSAELNNCLQFGGAIAFNKSLDELAADLQKVCPTHLISVPRVFNKVYDGIHRKMEEEGGIKLKLFNMALSEAQKRRKTNKTTFKMKMLDKVVFGKVRDRFGGRLQLALTASARVEPEIAEFFYDIGIPVYDCYGLTETSPALTMNRPKAHKLGSVGQPIEKTKILIDKSRVGIESEDGEIVVYGPQIMKGYHKKPEATQAIMTPDGGLRTGDRGKLDDEGYLHITGRFKEEYKLTNGKYVFPAQIEEYMKLNSWIADAMLYGDNRAFNIALIVPEFSILQGFLEKHGIHGNVRELIHREDIHKFLVEEIRNKLKSKIASYEIPQRFLFIEDPFSLDNGLLTQTLKLKRMNVIQKYRTQIDEVYQIK